MSRTSALGLRAEYEDYQVRLALLSETVIPRRLASAIRDRIETRGLRLADVAAEIGLPMSTTYKALHDPDKHLRPFSKVAAHYGYEHDEQAGTFRRKRVVA